MHDDVKAFLIVAIGALIATIIVASALVTDSKPTSPSGTGHRLLYSVDGGSQPSPAPLAADPQSDEVRAVRIETPPASAVPTAPEARGIRATGDPRAATAATDGSASDS
jgi:hypothetical protein